jgi:hypothetical protein
MPITPNNPFIPVSLKRVQVAAALSPFRGGATDWGLPGASSRLDIVPAHDPKIGPCRIR